MVPGIYRDSVWSLQAYVRHPELAAAKANRDYVMKQVCDAVNTISGVAQATGQSEAHPYEGAGELAAALDEFDVRNVILDVLFHERLIPHIVFL